MSSSRRAIDEALRARAAGVRGWVAGALLCVAWMTPGHAHHLSAGATPAGGIAIPGLTHGQMAAVALNSAAILGLADAQPPGDSVARRLREFVGFQSFLCGWGLVPGSLDDEASPFNECTHATLAATLALYRRIQERSGGDPAVGDVGARLQDDMLRHSAALVLCRFSDESFSTAEMITPSWRAVASSPPSLAALAGLLRAGGGMTWLLLGLTRRDMDARAGKARALPWTRQGEPPWTGLH